MAGRNSLLTTGAEVPETGIYRVAHANHRLPHEVVVLKGDRFPRCAKCQDQVLFDLIRAVPDVSLDYKIYELPVLEDEPAKSA